MSRINDQRFTVAMDVTLLNYGNDIHVTQVSEMLRRVFDHLPPGFDLYFNGVSVVEKCRDCGSWEVLHEGDD